MRYPFFLFLIFISIFFEPIEAKKYKHQLAICAIFRDEARFLKEWIEFHRLLGVTHFYLYNHFSTDHYEEVLEPYIQINIVELTDWFYEYTTTDEWTKIQTKAYFDAIQKAIKHKVKWLAILDTDEFLYPTQHSSLPTFLRQYEGFGGVAVNWQLFGTSNIEKIPADKLMIEMLNRKAPCQYAENAFIKSIVSPEKVHSIEDPHCPKYKPPYFQVNENKDRVKHSKSNICVEKIRINHYWSRDNEFFMTHKVPRRQNWKEGIDGQLNRLNNINAEEDHTIDRYIEPLKNIMQLN